jgi:hypothetical protein
MLFALGLASNARADPADVTTETIVLNVANPNLATQGSGPYATYVISLDADTGLVSVTATGDNSFVFGDSSIIDLNLSSTAGTVSNFSGTGLTLATSPPSTSQVDGFGMMNFTLNDGSGFSSPSSSFTFSFNISNHTLTGVSQLLATNSNGTDVAAHMALSTNTACTGFAGNGSAPTGSPDNSACTSAAPEPSSAALLLVGVVLIGGTLVLRRRETDDLAI